MNNVLDAVTLARKILQGFHKHYSVFQEVTQHAKQYYADGNWQAIQHASAARINFYDQRVRETIAALQQLTGGELEQPLWLEIRQVYQQLLQFHPQAELAEPFENAVDCRLMRRSHVETTADCGASTSAGVKAAAFAVDARCVGAGVARMQRSLTRSMAAMP